MRRLVARMGLAMLVMAAGLLSFEARPVTAQTTGTDKQVPPRFIYTGAGSCASSNCHGSITPQRLPQIDIRQNEHYVWLKTDKHARAYEVLHQERSVHMAAALGLKEGAHQSPKCLACHALRIPTAQQGPYYQIEDGVSCEACHGPAESWLGTHITRGYKASLKVGMYDTKDLLKRAEKCLACHVGDAERDVDHEMIAAGHPALLFELDTFTALMPPHWRPAEGIGAGIRAWSIGQVIALRERTKRLARRSQQQTVPGWPEFAEFDCYACHHEVRNVASTAYRRGDHGLLKAGQDWQPSWRQVRGYDGVAGIPVWQAPAYLVFRHLVEMVAPEVGTTLDQELADLAKQLQKVAATDPQRLAQSALRVTHVVEPLIPKVVSMTFDADLVVTLLRRLSADGAVLATSGIRVAEQTVMAVESLVIAYKKQVKKADTKAVDEALQKLFELLEKPQQYDPQVFKQQLQVIHGFFEHG